MPAVRLVGNVTYVMYTSLLAERGDEYRLFWLVSRSVAGLLVWSGLIATRHSRRNQPGGDQPRVCTPGEWEDIRGKAQ
ncbi:MAG: hypothetical protein N2037_12870 [Acidimicrobiales bacterium]|nr:hypothetical protein [Acidimicrobiales bacterium]